MKPPEEKPRVAILGLSLDLYDRALPGYMDRLGRQLARFVAQLEPRAAIVSSTLCYRRETVVEAIRSAEQDNVDALLVIPLSYTTSGMSSEPLLRTDLPLVIWNTQEAESFGEKFTFDDVLMMHMQECNPALARSDRKVRLIRKDFWAPGVEPYVAWSSRLSPVP